MLSYADAERKMAMLMLAEMKFHEENIVPIIKKENPDLAEGTTVPITNLPEELKQRRKSLHHDVEQYGKELAARPEFFDIMQPWMVDVVGCKGDGCDVKEVLEDLDFKKMIEQQGPLAAQVQKFITECGFEITDRGGGGGSWHVGVPCNDVEARKLCSLVHIQFKKAIDYKLIKVIRHFWGWKLPTLPNWNAVEEYFKDNKNGHSE